MFSAEAESAYLSLQDQALSATDNYTLERVERALDEILRNPAKTAPAAFQVRSAMANAAKVIEDRRRLAPRVSIETPGVEPGTEDGGYVAVEVMHWLDTAPVSDAERTILRGLAHGADAETLAASGGVGVQRMRERISRARKSATQNYQRTVAA